MYSTACPDWEKKIVRGESIIPPPIFPETAQKGLDIFKSLRIPDLPGKPTFGEISAKWVFDFVAAIFGAYDANTGEQLIKEFFLLVGKKNTKALALDTPIPTPCGWKYMKDIKVGDYVFGVDGNPAKVFSVSEVFVDSDCYELTFSNGEKVVASGDHLWATNALQSTTGLGEGNHSAARKSFKRGYGVRTTEQIYNTLERPDGARNHSLEMPKALQLPEIELPIKPYTLGAWLGDGHSKRDWITTKDLEILDAIRDEGYPVSFAYNNGSDASSYRIGGSDRSICRRGHRYSEHGTISSEGYPKCLKCERQLSRHRRGGPKPDKVVPRSVYEKLKSIGLVGNKHIPDIYFRASYNQRLSLLQGLMDTDGCINKNGRCLVFSVVNKRLAQDFWSLLATLGIKSSIIEREVKVNGRYSSQVWEVQFNTFIDDHKIFRVKRKLERMNSRDSLTMRPISDSVQITGCKKVATVPTKCIAVDSPENLFLFGETILPTHNSTISAAVMLTAFILCWREEEEHLILAPTKEVADAAFNPAAGMIRADEELSTIFNVQDYIRTISHRVNHNSLKIVAADSKTATGKKAGRILIDEIHEFGKMGKANNIFLEATGGMVSRPEGFVIYLSSQSEEPPAGIFKEKLDYFRNVRDGVIEDNKVLPVLYEFPKKYTDEKLYLEPKNFIISNPNLGRSVSQSWLEDNLRKAQHSSDGSLQQFLAKHLNVEIGLALRNDRWAGVEFWEDAQMDLSLDDLLDRSEVVTVGIDGGGLDDMLAVYVLGREQETGTWLGWGQAWIHPVAIERRKENESLYKDFSQAGQLHIVKRVGEDAEQVADVVEQVFESGLLDAVGCDPVGIGDILDRLEAKEIPSDQIAGVSQGWRLGGAIKTTERRLADGGFKPARQELMSWCVSNARIEDRANSILITKAASGKGKIDPVMAMLNAAFLMMANPEPRNKKLILASATRRG